MTDDFWVEQADQSRVKTEIVVDYLKAWWQIMKKRAPQVGYVDLFSGPGRFDDGTESTPLLVLRTALEDKELSSRLKTFFNDINERYVRRLRQTISEIDGIGRLRYPPIVKNSRVSAETEREIERTCGQIPILSFLDPWGYVGLSAKLIAKLVRGFGSDAIFFFNYTAINRAITLDSVGPHLAQLLGPARLAKLRQDLPAPPDERERRIVKALMDSLQERDSRLLTLTFRVWTPRKTTSHYICFTTKNPTAYKVMKDIMARRGWVDEDGVPRLEYVPPSSGRPLGLFESPRPLRELPSALLDRFAGRSVRFRQLVDEHHVGTPFVEANYRTVLLTMEQQGQIECDPPADRRRRRQGRPTLSDNVVIRFPNRP
ncbi:MAG TPA: three-Cys-motif partner protein TcmP [Dehalococcoidia bacterium]|nr:three-Cys-motif partner protein TcmP [Dehalococcoidia bacterium]